MKIDTKDPRYVIAYGAVVSLLFTAAIMSVHAWTRPIVERNEKVARQKALVEVFQLGDPDELSDGEIIDLYQRHVRKRDALTTPDGEVTFGVWEARTDANALIGYAFTVWGSGFWERIDGVLAVNPEMTRTLGLAFLKHAETPGLGGRITEMDFRRPFFEGVDISQPAQASQRVIYVAPEDSVPAVAQDRRVDAITGATGTSNAVQRFLRERIGQFRAAARSAGLVAGGTNEP
jgi:Na+-transporting NADH:ubiquinone oxidoreductase subunit C